MAVTRVSVSSVIPVPVSSSALRWARVRQSGTSPDTWYGMPQMEKFGCATASSTLTSVSGASSRAAVPR
jgi:hypothetical protein